MKTFKEFVANKLEENVDDIIGTANDLEAKDKKVVPGATDDATIQNVQKTPQFKNLLNKKPDAAGGLLNYLRGKQAIAKPTATPNVTPTPATPAKPIQPIQPLK